MAGAFELFGDTNAGSQLIRGGLDRYAQRGASYQADRNARLARRDRGIARNPYMAVHGTHMPKRNVLGDALLSTTNSYLSPEYQEKAKKREMAKEVKQKMKQEGWDMEKDRAEILKYTSKVARDKGDWGFAEQVDAQLSQEMSAAVSAQREAELHPLEVQKLQTGIQESQAKAGKFKAEGTNELSKSELNKAKVLEVKETVRKLQSNEIDFKDLKANTQALAVAADPSVLLRVNPNMSPEQLKGAQESAKKLVETIKSANKITPQSVGEYKTLVDSVLAKKADGFSWWRLETTPDKYETDTEEGELFRDQVAARAREIAQRSNGAIPTGDAIEQALQEIEGGGGDNSAKYAAADAILGN